MVEVAVDTTTLFARICRLDTKTAGEKTAPEGFTQSRVRKLIIKAVRGLIFSHSAVNASFQ
jgi:hypothetical protein